MMAIVLDGPQCFCGVVGLDGRCSVQAEQRNKPVAVGPLPGAYLSTETNFVPIRGVTRKEFDTGHTHTHTHTHTHGCGPPGSRRKRARAPWQEQRTFPLGTPVMWTTHSSVFVF